MNWSSIGVGRHVRTFVESEPTKGAWSCGIMTRQIHDGRRRGVITYESKYVEEYPDVFTKMYNVIWKAFFGAYKKK